MDDLNVVFVYRRVKELEDEVTLVGNNLRSLEISEGKATEREESYEDKIRSLTQQLEDVSSSVALEGLSTPLH